MRARHALIAALGLSSTAYLGGNKVSAHNIDNAAAGVAEREVGDLSSASASSANIQTERRYGEHQAGRGDRPSSTAEAAAASSGHHSDVHVIHNGEFEATNADETCMSGSSDKSSSCVASGPGRGDDAIAVKTGEQVRQQQQQQSRSRKGC